MSSLNGVMQAAARNAASGNNLAMEAGQIIAARAALGMAATIDPLAADHAEFSRMIPEKLEAFFAAGFIALEHSHQAGWEIVRRTSDEVMTTATAAVSMGMCTDPVTQAQAQGRFALAWLDRAATNVFALGLLMLDAQHAAMAPIQRTIAANTERLAR